MTTNTFSSSNASNAAATAVRFKKGNVLSYYTNTSSYGLLPGTTYHYSLLLHRNNPHKANNMKGKSHEYSL
jgi:hypothetical protein